MKPVFKCDYCPKMGTEEEIREHEPVCTDNYDRRSCHTCKYKSIKTKDKQRCYECTINGIDIPSGKFFEFCEAYERNEKAPNILATIFPSVFD